MWRRLHLIGFEHQVPEKKRISDLDRQLLAEEAGGILKWMVDGALMWKKQELKPPASIKQATAHYRKECDLIEEWMSECCELAPEAATEKATTYSSFSSWCTRSGIARPMTQKRFTRSLRERGHESGYEKVKVYLGFRLRPGCLMM
jgi:putative DNA primase/helicase